MRTEHVELTIQQLSDAYHTIEYPEFQREPSVWGLKNKQLLIDSILREFDIGSIYLIWGDDGRQLQCIDGRQRLNTIFSFLGQTGTHEKHHAFAFVPYNEVAEDARFEDIRGVRYAQSRFDEYREDFLSYRVRVVRLLDVDDLFDDSDLNLQFQRLQVAQILNSAEKLNAMVGFLRDSIFSEGRIGENPYFTGLGARRGRFGPKQTASQVAVNALSQAEKGQFSRARFVDMQICFKRHGKSSKLSEEVVASIERVGRELYELLSDDRLANVKNRALAVSVFLLFYLEKDSGWFIVERFPEFLDSVFERLQRVRENGVSFEQENRDEWESFQVDLTQASVERPAIERRHETLKTKFCDFLESGRID